MTGDDVHGIKMLAVSALQLKQGAMHTVTDTRSKLLSGASSMSTACECLVTSEHYALDT